MGHLSRDYKEFLLEQLKDPAEAMSYLNAALEDKENPEVFLLALRDVAEVYGMRKAAKKAGLNREGFYQMLSKRGNPTIASLFSVLNVLGFVVKLDLKTGKKNLKKAA
jgi:probable addiction module antidote protein